MTEVIPAVIGKDFAEVQEKVNKVESLVTWVQLDVMDGIFVPEYTWQEPHDLENLHGKIKLEAHLMVKDPEQIVEEWLPVCDRVLVHYESTDNIEAVLKTINQSPCKAGLAILLQTPLEKVFPLLDQVEVVQLMSIATIGHHGEPLDERVYERISALRQKSKTVKINIDGGVTLDNAAKLITAGADGLVVGSAIWQASNIADAIDALRRTN
jgi:ribulose-phosphate 3-epimerase